LSTPLYIFGDFGVTLLRRAGSVQGFFAPLLEKNKLSRADQGKGLLRKFLLGSPARIFVQRVRSDSPAQKRRRNRIVSIDEHLPEAEAFHFGSCSSHAIRAVMI